MRPLAGHVLFRPPTPPPSTCSLSCRGSESVPLAWPQWAQTRCWAETDARQEGDQSLRSASLPSVSGHPASHPRPPRSKFRSSVGRHMQKPAVWSVEHLPYRQKRLPMETAVVWIFAFESILGNACIHPFSALNSPRRPGPGKGRRGLTRADPIGDPQDLRDAMD